MGFLFGMLIGGMMGSSGPMGLPAPSMLGSIPLRCLAAFEVSDAEYTTCRRPSMRADLYYQSSSRQAGAYAYCADKRAVGEGEYPKEDCDVNMHIAWELKALRSLQEIAKKQADAR